MSENDSSGSIEKNIHPQPQNALTFDKKLPYVFSPLLDIGQSPICQFQLVEPGPSG